MKTIELSKFVQTKKEATDGLSKWYVCDAYAIAFVYPKVGEPTVVKGMYEQLKDYVKQNFPIALVNLTLWKNGNSRGYWYFNSNDGFTRSIGKISSKRSLQYSPKGYRRGYNIRIGGNNTLHFRRMPKKWLKEFDNIK